MSPRDIRPPLDEAAPLTKAPIAATLAEIADLLEIKGASGFKVGAYRRGADSVARSSADVAAAYRAGEPPPLRGVGASIAERISELATSGRLGYHADLREEVPPTLLELLGIPGVGPRTVGELWRRLGIATLPSAVLDRLRRRMPLRALACETGLPPLPTHLSWRVDPTSVAQKTLIDSLLSHRGVEPSYRKNR